MKLYSCPSCGLQHRDRVPRFGPPTVWSDGHRDPGPLSPFVRCSRCRHAFWLRSGGTEVAWPHHHEQVDHEVRLLDAGPNLAKVIGALRKHLAIGFADARALVAAIPTSPMSDVRRSVAFALRADLVSVGARASVFVDGRSCDLDWSDAPRLLDLDEYVPIERASELLVRTHVWWRRRDDVNLARIAELTTRWNTPTFRGEVLRQLGRFDEAEAVLADAKESDERHVAEQLLALVRAKSIDVQPLDAYAPTLELADLSIATFRAALPDPVDVSVDEEHTYLEAGSPGLVALRVSPHDIAVHVYSLEWTGPHTNVRTHPLLAQWSLAEVTTRDVEVALREALRRRLAAFSICTLCHRAKPPEWSNGETCDRCAERHLGVVH
jgi:hypothetical protein